MADHPCCGEYKCRRQQPIMLSRGGFSQRWYAVTRWKDKGNGLYEAIEKHELPAELSAALDVAARHKDEVAHLLDEREAALEKFRAEKAAAALAAEVEKP